MTWSGYTEGGQGSEERGPSSFTFTPPGVPQQRGSQPVMAKMGYQTAQSVGGITEYGVNNKTAEALFTFAEGMLAPVAKELAAKKFLEGVQRAASGEALTQIVNEQPWYSRIFGPSSAVEGARQYSLDAQAAKFDAEVQQLMPTLRNTSPDQLPEIILEVSKRYETGDQMVDNQLGLRLTKVIPNLIQQHTREFYKAQQENAVSKRQEAMQQNATSLQAIYASGVATEDDILLREQQVLQGLVLPPGVDAESHMVALQEHVMSLAESGQFHALNLVERSGVLNDLTTKQRTALNRQLRTLRQQAARDAADDYAEPIARWRMKSANNEYASGAEVSAEADRINAEYARLSGNTESLIHKPEKVSTLQSAMQAKLAYDREAAAEVKRQADAAAAEGMNPDPQQQEALVAKMLATSTVGDTKRALKAEGISSDIVDKVAREEFMKHAGNYEAQAAWLTKQSVDGSKVASIQADITAAVFSAQDAMDANFLNAYQLYQAIQKAHPTLTDEANPALAAYFDNRTLSRLGEFHKVLGGKPVHEAGERAFAMSQAVVLNPGHRYNQEEEKKYEAFIDTSVRGNKFWGGGYSEAGNENGYFSAPRKPYPSSMLIMRAYMQSNHRAAQNGTTPDLVMSESFNRSKAAGMEVYGPFAWSTGPGREPLLDKLMHQADGTVLTQPIIAKGLDDFVHNHLASITNKTPDDILVTRGADDRDGNPTFSYSARVDGVLLPEQYFTSSDLVLSIKESQDKDKREAAKDAKRHKVLGVRAEFGPKLTYPPTDDKGRLIRKPRKPKPEVPPTPRKDEVLGGSRQVRTGADALDYNPFD